MNQLNSIQMLMASMTKAEKRHFRLYSQRIGRANKKYFLQLYDILDRYDIANDELLKVKINEPSLKRHLPFFKNLLFEMIMEGLLDMYRGEGVHNLLRRWLHQAEILLQRGMYVEAERLLLKVQKTAIYYECFEEQILLNKILITLLELKGNELDNIALLLQEQLHIVKKVETETKLHELYNSFIQEVRRKGRTMSATEKKEFARFKELLLHISNDLKGFISEFKILSFQSSYSYIIDRNPEKSYATDKAILDLFDSKKQFINLYPLLYLKTFSNVIQSALGYKYEVALHFLALLKKQITRHPAFLTTYIKSEADRIVLNLDVSVCWWGHDFKKLISFQPLIERIYINSKKPVDELKRQHLLLVLSISYFHLNDANKSLDFATMVINDKNSPSYMETYFDSLLIKWIVYFKREDLEATQSVYNSMQYLIKRNKSKDEVCIELMQLLRQIQQWNKSKEFIKIRIEKIKNSMYLSDEQIFSRRHWILKKLIENY